MSKDPEWYAKLDRPARDRWDQAGHFAIGFFLTLGLSPLAAWAFCHWREFYLQWPIERVLDTRHDLNFCLLGATVATPLFLLWFWRAVA